jgi:hypothetical protein
MALPVLVLSGLSQSHALNRLATLSSFAAGTVYKCVHILPTAACLAWLVQDLGARSKVLILHVLINHSVYTSQARIAILTIHTILQGF